MPRIQLRRYFFRLAILISTLCPVLSARAQAPDFAELTQKLEALTPEVMENLHVPGIALALIYDSSVAWVKGFGYADKEKQTPVTGQTLFQACSISKAVAAWGAMRLVEQGKIKLDAPIWDVVKRWHVPPSEFDANEITLRRLLSHTAGLSLHGYLGFPPEHPLPTLEASLSGDTNGSGDVRLKQKPGEKYDYSGGGFTIAQLAIEEVTGRNFAQYMKEEVLVPLGMVHNSYEWNDEVAARVATPYDRKGEKLPNFLFEARAAAGLFTSAETLARFGLSAFRGPNGEAPGRGILKPETIELMMTPADPEKTKYGLGYEVAKTPGGIQLRGHKGGSRGWNTQLTFSPERREGIVILTNSDYGYRAVLLIEKAWINWLDEKSESGAEKK